jgi:hypothetical protein
VHGVVVQQRDERLYVVALERLDVTREQRLLRGVDRLRGAIGDVAALERGPGSLQGAVDRRHGRVEQLRRLDGAHAQHLAQHEHRALARR